MRPAGTRRADSRGTNRHRPIRLHQSQNTMDDQRLPQPLVEANVISDLLPWGDDVSKIISKPEQCQQRY